MLFSNLMRLTTFHVIFVVMSVVFHRFREKYVMWHHSTPFNPIQPHQMFLVYILAPNELSVCSSLKQLKTKMSTVFRYQRFKNQRKNEINENYHNSRTRNDIDTKLGPVAKLEKTNTAMSTNLAIASSWEIATTLSFSQFLPNSDQCGSWIPDAWSVKLTFSLIVIFCRGGSRDFEIGGRSMLATMVGW